MKSTVEAIIFDADGVIFDSEKLWDAGDAEFMARRGIGKIDEQIKSQLAGTSLMDGTSLLLDSFQISESVETAAQERIQIMEEKYANEIEYMAGFLPFLNFVNQKKVNVAVATSMSEHLFPILEKKMGFIQLFNGHVYSVAHVKNAKPAPDIYLYAADRIGVNPGNCLVIEDAPNGIKAAKAAGMFCIGLATTFNPDYLEDADIIFQNFKDIESFIERLK